MNPFRRRGRRPDPTWEVAARTQILVADDVEVLDLVQSTRCRRASVDGVLVARRHPTGWFVHAVRSQALDPVQSRYFEELVTVRVHLLLGHGPLPPVWEQVPREDEWRSAALSPTGDLAALSRELNRWEGVSWS